MNIHLATLGCRLNEAELESWARGFHTAGWSVVSSPQHAHVIVLNSCAVTIEAARKSRQFVNRLHRQNPSARLIVTGCYAELEPETVKSLTGVDLVIGNRAKEEMVDLVLQHIDIHAMPAMAEEPDGSHVYQHARTRAFVKVQDGCRNRCRFCIVTIARGVERSRPIVDLVDEINTLHAGGYQEAVLTGVHLGGYGSDLNSDLYTLVLTLLAETDIPRLRLSSLEPWDIPDNFWELWEHARLMPHLHLPLQSGCDSTLQRMARRYSTGDYRCLVDSARTTIPDLTLTTDLIAGFPGESEAEWTTSLETVREIGFAHVHIFTYSARQGTVAARLSGQIEDPTKRARSRQMHQIAAAMRHEHLARYLGSTRPVLWEGQGKKQADGRRGWIGYTDNYLRVWTATETSIDLENRITPTTLQTLNGKPADHLRGVADVTRDGDDPSLMHPAAPELPVIPLHEMARPS